MKIKNALFLLLICLSQVSIAQSQSEINKKAYLAIKNGDVETVRDLIDQGIEPNFRLGEPENLLRMAAFLEKPIILADLISAGGNVDHKLDRGMYFINFVFTRDNRELLKLVLKKGMNLNKVMYFDQFTIFTNMLNTAGVKELEYIIDKANVDLNFKPKNGYSALYILYDRGSCGIDCIKVLLENCANPMLEIRSGGVSFKEYIQKKGDAKVLNLINDISC